MGYPVPDWPKSYTRSGHNSGSFVSVKDSSICPVARHRKYTYLIEASSVWVLGVWVKIMDRKQTLRDVSMPCRKKSRSSRVPLCRTGGHTSWNDRATMRSTSTFRLGDMLNIAILDAFPPTYMSAFGQISRSVGTWSSNPYPEVPHEGGLRVTNVTTPGYGEPDTSTSVLLYRSRTPKL